MGGKGKKRGRCSSQLFDLGKDFSGEARRVTPASAGPARTWSAERQGAEWVLGERLGMACSACSDFPNFPPPPAAAFAPSPPVAELRWCSTTQSCWGSREEEEEVVVEEERGGGRWALPPGWAPEG